MIVDKFRLFEQAMDGAPEKLDEGIFSSLTNFLSRMFGGAVSKLDDILSRYEDSKTDYWKEFVDANDRIAKSEALLKQSLTGPERSKNEEIIRRNKQMLAQIESRRGEVEKSLDSQAKAIIKSNARLQAYWDMNKAKVDEETAKSSFNEFKKLVDDDRINGVFDEVIKRAGEDRKKHEELFKRGADSYMSDYVGTQGSYGQIIAGINVKDVLSKGLTEPLRDKLTGMSDAELTKLRDAIRRKADDERKYQRNIAGNRESVKKKLQEISDNEKSVVEFIDYVMTSDDIAREIKGQESMMTPITDVELAKQGTDSDEVAQDAIKETPKPITAAKVAKEINSTVIDNFKSSKDIIEQAIKSKIKNFDKIDDAHYEKLTKDMVELYGKLALYYTEKGANKLERTLTHDVIDFASELYMKKKKMDKLKFELGSRELQKIFDEYDK